MIKLNIRRGLFLVAFTFEYKSYKKKWKKNEKKKINVLFFSFFLGGGFLFVKSLKANSSKCTFFFLHSDRMRSNTFCEKVSANKKGGKQNYLLLDIYISRKIVENCDRIRMKKKKKKETKNQRRTSGRSTTKTLLSREHKR